MERRLRSHLPLTGSINPRAIGSLCLVYGSGGLQLGELVDKGFQLLPVGSRLERLGELQEGSSGGLQLLQHLGGTGRSGGERGGSKMWGAGGAVLTPMSLKLCRELRARLLSGYPAGREIPREFPNATS